MASECGRVFYDRIKIATAKHLSDEAIAAMLARTAKEALAKAISTGEGSRNYERFVNGRKGVPEEQVKPPGPILYMFKYWDEIAEFALLFLRQRSPVGPPRDGHYRDSHFVMYDGRQVSPNAIPNIAREITIVNDRPYARKIHTGAKGFQVSRGIYENARMVVNREFRGLATARVKFIRLEGAYALRRRVTSTRRARALRAVGTQITYPALHITLVEN